MSEELSALLDGPVDDERADEFWRRVGQNLTDGDVRLIFLADETHRDLRRIVEYLDMRTERIELYCVEVRQYVGDGEQVLVPRAVGVTETARRKKQTSPASRAGPWTETEILEAARESLSADVSGLLTRYLDVLRRIYAGTGAELRFGAGPKTGTFDLRVRGTTIVAGSSRGQISIHVGAWSRLGDEGIVDLLRPLDDALGTKLADAFLASRNIYPSIQNELLARDPELEKLTAWIEDAVALFTSKSD